MSSSYRDTAFEITMFKWLVEKVRRNFKGPLSHLQVKVSNRSMINATCQTPRVTTSPVRTKHDHKFSSSILHTHINTGDVS